MKSSIFVPQQAATSGRLNCGDSDHDSSLHSSRIGSLRLLIAGNLISALGLSLLARVCEIIMPTYEHLYNN